METQRGPGEASATTEPQRPNVGTTVEQAAEQLLASFARTSESQCRAQIALQALGDDSPISVRSGAVRPGDEDVDRETRELVTQEVQDWKQRGDPPERVVIGIKRVIERAGRGYGAVPVAQLHELMLRWALDAYYRAD